MAQGAEELFVTLIRLADQTVIVTNLVNFYPMLGSGTNQPRFQGSLRRVAERTWERGWERTSPVGLSIRKAKLTVRRSRHIIFQWKLLVF